MKGVRVEITFLNMGLCKIALFVIGIERFYFNGGHNC
jgi:hypothetical protein